MKSLKIKLYLNSNQEMIINTLSNEHRLLYNHLLESVKSNKLNFKDINQKYKDYRNTNQLTINSKSAQNTSISLINNIKSFFALRKKDKTAKFPYKFKSYKYFTSFMYDYNNGNGGFNIKDNILTFNLYGNKRNKNSKDLVIELPKYFNKINNNTIKTITISKEDSNYYICFVYSEKESNKISNKDFLSIDLGYSELVTCYSNKINNFSINNLKLKRLQKTIEILQSIKDKKVKNSNSYKNINNIFKKVKRKQVNKLKDFHHKVSTNIIKICKNNQLGNLIVGDIKVKKIIDKSNKKINGLSKSTGLSRFKTFLEYKAKNVGIGFHSINEAYTSQTNCITNKIELDSKLSNRTVKLKDGLYIDRDLNSAINIAKKCKVIWLDHLLNFNLDKMYNDCNSNLLLI